MSASENGHTGDCCFICERPFKAGEMVLQDVTEGLGHRACFGDDREGYVHLDTGAPLAARAPLPTGFPYDPAEFADPSPTEREVSSERVSEEKLAEVRGWCAERKAQKPWYGEGEDSPKMLTTCDFMISLIDELLALRSSVKTVGVKKLEWVKHPTVEAWRADTMLGTYQVWVGSIGTSWQFDSLLGEHLDTKAGDEHSAKSAAQADFERRILSALEAPSSEKEGVAAARASIAQMPAVSPLIEGLTDAELAEDRSSENPNVGRINVPSSEQEVVKIGYTNWRGEYAEREIVPMRPWFSATDWHPEPQWLLKAWDIAKGAERDFAIKDIGFKPTPQEAPIEVTEDAVFRAMTKADDLDIALCDDDAREILAAALKGDRH